MGTDFLLWTGVGKILKKRNWITNPDPTGSRILESQKGFESRIL